MKWLTQNPIMLLLRSTLFSLGQVTTLVVFSLIGIVLLFPFNVKVRYRFMSKWAVFVVWWAKVTCGIRYQIHGAENIDTSQAGILLARHESAWETFATQLIFPRQAFVLKRELLNIPFFGWGMRMLNPIAIDRGAGRQALNQLLKEGKQRLEQGDWVVIFPEGTRMPAGELGKINVGGSMLAVQTGAPTYLLAHNAGCFWPKNSFIKRPGTVEVFISPALDPKELGVKGLNQAIEDWFVKYGIAREQETCEAETM